MRTLGDMSWLNDYIGLPYAFNGRDREGVDCYGICKLIYAEQYGIELPDWTLDEFDIKRRNEVMNGQVTSGVFTETDEPSDSDFVVCYRTRAAHHMGLFYANGIIHSTRGTGVVYEPLSRFIPGFVKVVFGSWHP